MRNDAQIPTDQINIRGESYARTKKFLVVFLSNNFIDIKQEIEKCEKEEFTLIIFGFDLSLSQEA